ncbi:MAG TPA: peptidoglycan DD-metalloendopeptidase family protein [Candidatus Limnocylindrales bacterium]|nr:peptidoglycan DD-metalloendopeptidase family protein [Candidatus Limnocylindrales bacterium]
MASRSGAARSGRLQGLVSLASGKRLRPAYGLVALVVALSLAVTLLGGSAAIGHTSSPSPTNPRIAALFQANGDGLSHVEPAGVPSPSATGAPASAAPVARLAVLGPVDHDALIPGGQLLIEPESPPSIQFASYTVKAGDTLYEIAARFGIHFDTLYWANKLSDPRILHLGQVLRVPPVDGVVYTVKAGDTVDSIAAHFKVDVASIVDFNQLAVEDLPAGEQIMVPDANGPALPTPKPTPKPKTATHTSSSGASYGGAFVGRMTWPVPGGTISQYFHTGHYALDIAAPKGTRVVAAAPGKVIYAGWGDNGGGYQVWISHGSNVYTTYNHMELVSVHVGQVVVAGQQVGRVGMTGWATGPHCHFEVWIGKVWNGGRRVNPLNYLR